MNDDDIAARLYPNSPPAQVLDLTPSLITEAERQIADNFYPDRPDLDAPPPGELYSTSGALRMTTTANNEKLFDEGVLQAAQAELEHQEFSAMVREQQLDFAFAQRLHDAYTESRLAGARHEATGGDAALAAKIRKDVASTRQALRERYGLAEAENLIDRAMRFKAQDPRLSAILDTDGLLWQPDVFLGVVETMRAVNFR